MLLLHSSFPEPFAEPNLKCMKCVCGVSAELPWLASSCFPNLINLLRISSSWLVTRFKVGFYFLKKKKMLIYLLQRVWFNGGFKREYCSVKILEYSIWIFKVAVKVFGGCFCSWSGESRWALAASLQWGHLRHLDQGSSLERLLSRHVALSIRSSCKYLKVGGMPFKFALLKQNLGAHGSRATSVWARAMGIQ